MESGDSPGRHSRLWHYRGPEQRQKVPELPTWTGHRPLEFRAGAVETVELVPLFGRRQEGMDQGITGDRLERPVTQAELAGGAEIFIAEVDPGHTGVVGGKHRRHFGREIGRQRMIPATHTENEIAAGDADL